MKCTIEQVSNGFMITVRNLKYYPRGMSRLQDTYAHAVWVAEWFIRKLPKSVTRPKRNVPLDKRFPSPRMHEPHRWGLELKVGASKKAYVPGMSYH